MGVIEYFGQDETLAGQTAGERLTTDGAKKALCVIQEQGHVSLEARCAGVARGFKADGKSQRQRPGSGIGRVDDHGEASAGSFRRSRRYARRTDRVDRGPVGTELRQRRQGGHLRHQRGASGRDQVRRCSGRSIQQPFLQGYLAVDALWLYLNNRNTIGGGTPVLTGPAFIDKSNIDAVAEYAKNGTL